MIDEKKWQGKFIISVRNKATGDITEHVISNRVMDATLDVLANTLVGTASNIQIKYLAIGTGSTAITDTDATLDTEIFRTAPVSGPTNVSTGQIETEFVVLDTEAVAQIEEIGIFVGTTATGSADSGTLLSRILWSKIKTSQEEITFKRIDKVVRG